MERYLGEEYRCTYNSKGYKEQLVMSLLASEVSEGPEEVDIVE